MGLLNIFKKPANTKDDETSLQTRPSDDLLVNAENTLTEVNLDLMKVDAVELPFAQLSALGGAFASMLPALRTVSGTISQADGNIYRCVFPEGVKGYLATSRSDGLNLGTILDKHGIAGQARWEKVGQQTSNLTAVAPINPATLMMAAAIMSIEKKLDDVIQVEKQILSFLEEDKESKIEGDLKTLTSILKDYKFNWDNATYTTTHHQVAADIKRDAEANMIFYQKQVADTLRANPALFRQQFVDSQQAALIKRFKYYRLSLYLFSFASFIEVLLQGQYEQAYLNQIEQSIEERSAKYQETYSACMMQLGKLTASSVEHHVLKGIGAAGKAVGKFIGSIPVIKEGQVDEWLIENGTSLEKTGDNYGREALKQFESIEDPGCSIFIENLSHMDRIFNQTQEVYIGRDSIYLVQEEAA